MASIGRDKNGHRRILFYDIDGTRKTLRLGKVSQKLAEGAKIKVESLLGSKILGNPIERETAAWLAGDGRHLRPKLERLGLVESTGAVNHRMTLDAFLASFIERHGANKKPATRIVWGQVVSMLTTYMPKNILLADVTRGHAKQFVESLRARGLASSTVHKRVGFARQFFNDAVDWELIQANPFGKVKTATSSAKSNVFVPRDWIDRILVHCDLDWQVIVALSRYGGLRCPSEVLSLRWGDIDWEGSRMSVREPKVEHHEGRGIRSVPMFPELRKIIDKAWDVAGEGEGNEFVVAKDNYRAAAMRPGGWANANLRTQFLKRLTKAGIPAWDRLFHSMRASRQTELEAEFPRHVVCSWMGNSAAVAEKSYLLTTEADFAKATKPDSAARNAARLDSKAARNAAPQPLATDTQENEKTVENIGKTTVFPNLFNGFEMEVDGLEPTTSCLQSKRSPN